MTAIANTTLHRSVHDIGIADPARIFTELNRLMKAALNQHSSSSKSDDGLDIGLCFVDHKRENLIFAGAGARLYYTAEGAVHQIKGDKQSIGYKSSSADYRYTNHTITLDSPMNFYMLTDGLTHQTGGKRGFPFGRRRFIRFLGDNIGKPLEVQRALLEQCFVEYRGNEPQLDDVTVLGFAVPEAKNIEGTA
jgi:serine phosphatase RsbU (regulator of sigma subunit)